MIEISAGPARSAAAGSVINQVASGQLKCARVVDRAPRSARGP